MKLFGDKQSVNVAKKMIFKCGVVFSETKEDPQQIGLYCFACSLVHAYHMLVPQLAGLFLWNRFCCSVIYTDLSMKTV